jgi:epoxyqueuosine reductase
MPHTSGLTSRIRTRALELGFERIGISPARRARRTDAFLAWLDRGLHGEMHYLARDPELRADPVRRDGWARSVISCSLNYRPSSAGEWRQAPGIVGLISRYAAGEDYHDVVGDKLSELLAFVRAERPGARGRIAVDTSPLLEREFAEASGVGWLAKNTMIIDPEIGSWTFLGELVIDVELVFDPAPEDRCGTCRACLDGCPTGAILEDRTLDATRCLSYLNIELRGAIPRAQRAELGDHLFGCDICQEVCPWNHDAPQAREPAFRPRRAYEGLSLADLVRMSEEEFRRLFAGSAMRRAKRRGLVRNALIVGANTADGEVIQQASRAMEDADPVIRGAAAWALGVSGGRSATGRLERARQREVDPQVGEEIEQALGGKC